MELSTINENINIHLRDYFSILRRRKWIAISFFFIAVTTVALATFVQKPLYKATASVIVDIESPDILSETDVVTLGESEYYLYRDYIETQQEIIKSRRTAHSVMKNLNLGQMKDFRKKKDPIKALLKKAKIMSVRDTRIIEIHAHNENPKLASRIANEFAKVYVDSNIALKIKASKQAQGWLKGEAEEQEKKVNDTELKLQRYKEKNGIFSIENQQDIINDTLITLNTSYLDAKKRRIQTETTYRNLFKQKDSLSIENLPAPLVSNENLQRLKEDHLKQESLLVEYREIYKHKHPKMIRLLENISHLKALINKEIETEYNNALREIETEYRNALEEENKLEIELDKQKKRALEFERKIINYNALKRELETNERILHIVLNRLRETSIASEIQTNNVRIQDIAEVPKKPVRPRKILNIALSIVLGLMGGVTLAFFRDYMDISLKDANEIAALLQLPILGSVPRVFRDKKNVKKKEDIDRIVEKDPHSLASEAYRTIRTNLLFSINHSSGAKSLVVTSSVPKEGKTLIAVNLATMIANSGEKVLLVDADLRKPRIHTVFDDKNEIGLSQFLLGKNDFDSICKSSHVNNLHIVTSGKITDGPSELISSENMKLFLKIASSRFSKIILDAPPVVLVTDAQILSSICTGVVLVAELGRATKTLLNNSKELLQKVDANIVGVIANNISYAKNHYSYPQYYYGKYYSHEK